MRNPRLRQQNAQFDNFNQQKKKNAQIKKND